MTANQTRRTPAGFTLVSNFNKTSLAPGESTNFTIRFRSTSVGTFGAPVSFLNSDSDESPFDLILLGTVATAPTSQIIDNGDAGFTTVGNFPKANQQIGFHDGFIGILRTVHAQHFQ